MAQATYKLLIDWDGDESYDHANSDVSADIDREAGLEWEYGRNYGSTFYGKSVAGRLSVALLNDDGLYSRFNTTSALFGLALPRRGVRLQIETNGGGFTTQWQGYLQNISTVPERGGRHLARLTAFGPLGLIPARRMYAAPLTDVDTGRIISHILDAVGIQGYRKRVLGLLPVGYWRLGEASGNAVDISGNGNDGTVTGVTYGETGLVAGDPDTCMEFDGATGDVDCGSPADLDDIFAGGGSVIAIINADSDGESSTGVIAMKTDWDFYVSGESGGAMYLQFAHDFSGGGGVWRSTDRVLTVGQTHRVGVTYDRDSVANDPVLYVDGVAVGVTETVPPVTAADSDAGSNLLIGNRPFDDRTFDGHIDEVAVFDTVLTTANMVALNDEAANTPNRNIDVGDTDVSRWLGRGQVGLNALRQVEDTEFGFLRERKNGAIGYDSRNKRLSGTYLTSQATYSDLLTSSLSIGAIMPSDPLRDVANIIRGKVRSYTISGLAVVWTLPESGASSPSLAAGEARTFVAEFPQEDSPVGSVGVDAWTTPVATTDYTANDQADGLGTDMTSDITVSVSKGTDEMAITLTNTHATTTAYITLLQARGTAITENDGVTIESRNQASIDSYGEREYQIVAGLLENSSDAKDFCDWALIQLKEPLPKLAITYLANQTQAAMDDALARDLSERITIVADNNTGLGINEDFFVEHIAHRVTGGLHRVTLTGSPSRVFGDFIVLDTGPGLDTGLLGA